MIGDGKKVVEQSSASNTVLLPGEKVLLLTDAKTKGMPDTTGWSKADLLKLANLLSMEVSFSGEGYSTKQSIEPGQVIQGDTLTFTLKKEN